GERAELAISQQVFVTQMPATRSVGGHLPDEQARADIADVALTVHTKPAIAARGDERERHVVPWLHRRHARPDVFDHTGTFVAAEQREPVRGGLTAGGRHLRCRHHVAGEEVVIGVADSGNGHPYHDFAGAGRIKNNLADLPVLADPTNYSGTTLHCILLDGGLRPLTP